jgi:hypothetical protein
MNLLNHTTTDPTNGHKINTEHIPTHDSKPTSQDKTAVHVDIEKNEHHF